MRGGRREKRDGWFASNSGLSKFLMYFWILLFRNRNANFSIHLSFTRAATFHALNPFSIWNEFRGKCQSAVSRSRTHTLTAVVVVVMMLVDDEHRRLTGNMQTVELIGQHLSVAFYIIVRAYQMRVVVSLSCPTPNTLTRTHNVDLIVTFWFVYFHPSPHIICRFFSGNNWFSFLTLSICAFYAVILFSLVRRGRGERRVELMRRKYDAFATSIWISYFWIWKWKINL